jgi:hypothetical protein
MLAGKTVGGRSILAYASTNLLWHIVFRVCVADGKIIFNRVLGQLGIGWGLLHRETEIADSACLTLQ